jgi:hypothetical protein
MTLGRDELAFDGKKKYKENFKKVICYFDFLGKNCSTTKRQGV